MQNRVTFGVVAVVIVLAAGCSSPLRSISPMGTTTPPPASEPGPTRSASPSCRDDCSGSPAPSSHPAATAHETPSLADLKDALRECVVFDEMEEKYALRISQTVEEGIIATSSSVPGVRWQFAKSADDPNTLRMHGLTGPASFILPEYAGLPLEDIPIVTWVASDGKEVDLAEGVFGYYAFLEDSPGVLDADAIVTMGVN